MVSLSPSRNRNGQAGAKYIGLSPANDFATSRINVCYSPGALV
jgi:hypothetical protein